MEIVQISLIGHLTADQLEGELAPVTTRLRASSDRVGLLVDCRRMASYESEARTGFVKWNRSNRAQIAGVAVVTDNVVWHMVISAMALASSQQMKPFASPEDARTWLARMT